MIALNRSVVIAKRELTSYFYSPIAYVTMTLFLLACGFVFLSDFDANKPAEMRNTFEWIIWLLVFVTPVICMGSIAQEWATGTVETLMTAPVSDVDVAVGKFLGAMSFLLVMLAPTLVFMVLLRIYGAPDVGPVLSGYLGIVLVGALFISVGLFCSAMTRSQVVAAVLAAAILFVLTIAPWWLSTQAKLSDFWLDVAGQFVYSRYTDFSRGLIDTGNVIFFLACTGVFLFLTVKVLETRRWK